MPFLGLKTSLTHILSKPELKEGVHKYLVIKDRFERLFTITDSAYANKGLLKDQILKDLFCEFYRLGGLGYPQSSVDTFFKEFDKLIKEYRRTKIVPLYEEVLTKLYSVNNHREVVFATKILHSFDNNLPIYDSVAGLKHFGISRESFDFENYKNEINSFMETPLGQSIITRFDAAFPNSGISDTKKIDFVLWQDR